jgi:hypothetical protein
MSITLAATWNPRGETLRFRKLYPFLSELYDHMYVVMPPNTHAGMVLSFRIYDKLSVVTVDDWAAGRYIALERAVNYKQQPIHYVDLDRLVRWAEKQPKELKETLAQIKQSECLVIGRTNMAYKTHPQALIQTEAMSNRMFSHILGCDLDLSAGSKGFRHDVAKFIITNSQPGQALGTDAEWVILAKRGGFQIQDYRVYGLDWESADRYSRVAADQQKQAKAAAEYDADPKNWQHRVAVANEIIKAGLDSLTRKLT